MNFTNTGVLHAEIDSDIYERVSSCAYNFVTHRFEIKDEYNVKVTITDIEGNRGEYTAKINSDGHMISGLVYGRTSQAITDLTNVCYTSFGVNGLEISIGLILSNNVGSVHDTQYTSDFMLSNFISNDYLLSGPLLPDGGFDHDGRRIATVEIDCDFPLFLKTEIQTRNDLIFVDVPGTYIKYNTVTQNISLPYSEAYTYMSEIASDNMDNVDKAVNYSDIANDIPQDKVWDIINYLKEDGVIVEQKAYCFRILPDAKIGLYVTEQTEGDGSPNMHLAVSDYPVKVKGYYQPDTSYVDANSVDSDYWWGNWNDANNNTQYIGYGATNIPIYRSYADLQKYFNGELDIEDAINGGDASVQTSSIGQLLSSSEIPTINLAMSGVGCFMYALSTAQLKEIMETYLFTDDQSLITTLKDALWTWGNNPIDFMIDCYYVPFSISAFYDTINANLKFGTYQFPGTTYPAIKETNGNRLTLFNTTFEGTYGDWRDYTQFSYDLFLPYIGFVSLDPQKYVNHKVKCEMMFDITTHNVRYYLFVDGLITDRFDGSVGINIPLMATDIVNKAKHDRDIKYGLVTSALSTGTQIGMGITSADIGGAMTGIVAGIGNIVNGVKQYQELGAKASSGVEGSFSSAMNVYDVSYAYLRITEEQMIIPAKTTQLYNHPSYYMGAVSSLSGYCELADIRFSSTATQPEIEEIQSLLRSGVIL